MCGPTQTVESFLNIDDGVAISVLKNVPAFVSIHNHKKKIERGRTKYSPSVSDETLEGLAFSLMASAAVNSQIVRPMSLYRRCDIMTKTRKNQSEPEDGLAQQTQVHSDRQFVRIDNCISEDNLCAVEVVFCSDSRNPFTRNLCAIKSGLRQLHRDMHRTIQRTFSAIEPFEDNRG